MEREGDEDQSSSEGQLGDVGDYAAVVLYGGNKDGNCEEKKKNQKEKIGTKTRGKGMGKDPSLLH
jgi:hypothetical protein